MERPTTKEREAATLYLTDLNGMKKNGDENSDQLRFYAKVKTLRSKTRSAYTLMDPGASHCYIDSTYRKQLGLPLCHAGRMSVIMACTKHPTSEIYPVWLEGNIRGIAGNYNRHHRMVHNFQSQRCLRPYCGKELALDDTPYGGFR